MRKVLLSLVGAVSILSSDSVDKIVSDEQSKLQRLEKVKGKAELDLELALKESKDVSISEAESYVKLHDKQVKELEDLRQKHIKQLQDLKVDNLHKSRLANDKVDGLKYEIERATKYIEKLS